MAIMGKEELASIRERVQRFGGRLEVRSVLNRVGWRGVTFDELKLVTQLDDKALREVLGHWMVSHCPGCDYWFVGRAVEPVLPKGECHLACTCPLGKPLAKWSKAFRENPDRPKGAELRKIPLI